MSLFEVDSCVEPRVSLLSDFRMVGRYALGLQRFLREPVLPDDAAQLLRHDIERREDNFLRLVEHAIFGNPVSPYLALLQRADCEFGDLQRMVASDGIEATLHSLHAAGVRVTFDEFKGRRPIERDSLHIETGPYTFGNPFTTRQFEGRTGGSTGTSARLFFDLELMAMEAPTHAAFLESYGLIDRPMALWRPLPPGVSGLNNALRQLKIGRTIARWFTQSPITWRGEAFRDRLLTWYTVRAARWAGRSFPSPQHVPLSEAVVVARWLADQRSRGEPAVLDTNASSGVRVCLAARDAGLEISDSFFRLGGEPFTSGKAAVFEAAGCPVASHYSMTELGRVGQPCPDGGSLDDTHLLTNKLAVIQRDVTLRNTTDTAPTLIFSTLHPACPVIMLNVETDDSGILEERSCSCVLGAVGLTQHVREIRSYEKLNSEGMTFFGLDLYRLVEHDLPQRLGGDATDYQLIEDERDGLPRVGVVVHPRIGTVSDREIVEVVLDALRQVPDGRMMSDRWREGDVLHVIRREPHATTAAKIYPLHTPQRT